MASHWRSSIWKNQELAAHTLLLCIAPRHSTSFLCFSMVSHNKMASCSGNSTSCSDEKMNFGSDTEADCLQSESSCDDSVVDVDYQPNPCDISLSSEDEDLAVVVREVPISPAKDKRRRWRQQTPESSKRAKRKRWRNRRNCFLTHLTRSVCFNVSAMDLTKCLKEIAQNGDVTGCVVADKAGLCLGTVGKASNESSGIVKAIADQVMKLHPDMKPPAIVLENDNVQCLVQISEKITVGIYKNNVP